GKEDVGTTPLFIIIGAQKAGTTNLRHNLLSHPSLAGSRTETHFFDWHFPAAGEGGDADDATTAIAEGGGAAAALRAYSRRLLQGRAGLVRAASDVRRVARGRAFVFDTSPSYYLIPAAAARAAALRPRARLVLLVRDPVERYFSAAHMVTCWNATVGLPTEAFHATGGAAARAAEFAAAYNASDADGCMGLPLRGGRCQWGAFTGNALARGLYADALRRWLRAFPARNVLVVDSARYFRATQAVLDEVLAFLGLPPH
ncbi:P-loop containing nucleoside triphosphate hydrolase protein, partial [Tribonema minus]